MQVVAWRLPCDGHYTHPRESIQATCFLVTWGPYYYHHPTTTAASNWRTPGGPPAPSLYILKLFLVIIGIGRGEEGAGGTLIVGAPRNIQAYCLDTTSLICYDGAPRGYPCHESR